MENNIRSEIASLKAEFGLVEQIPCSEEENEKYKQLLKEGKGLPVGIKASESFVDRFTKDQKSDLTEAEMNEYISLKQLSLLKTIKSCIVFFTVLTVIGLSLSIILALI